MAEARIDKWLWASRIFKTRTIAAEACKKGRVSINGTQVKPSRMIKPGEVIQVKKPPVTNLPVAGFTFIFSILISLLKLHLIAEIKIICAKVTPSFENFHAFSSFFCSFATV